MDNQRNLAIYRMWAPFYDWTLGRFFLAGRKRALALLDLLPGERALLPGIGTGQDLVFLPSTAFVTGIDYSPAMLSRAIRRPCRSGMTFARMDAQCLGFADDTFDAVVLNLILSVVPDGAVAFREAWRVLRPGGRVVIFDKFLPEAALFSSTRRCIGNIISTFGTDPNRRLSEIIQGAPAAKVARDEPSLLRGQYRVILVRKDIPPPETSAFLPVKIL